MDILTVLARLARSLLALALFAAIAPRSAYAAPEMAVRWTSSVQKAIAITVDGSQEAFKSCLSSGFQVRYRFEFLLCKHRSGLFSECGEQHTLIRTLEYDAVSESYRFVSDMLGDAEAPVLLNLSSEEEATKGIATIGELSLVSIGGPAQGLAAGTSPLYISIRLVTDCKGEYNQTLSRIGYFLTLGLLHFNESDSGWTNFTLEPNAKDATK